MFSKTIIKSLIGIICLSIGGYDNVLVCAILTMDTNVTRGEDFQCPANWSHICLSIGLTALIITVALLLLATIYWFCCRKTEKPVETIPNPYSDIDEFLKTDKKDWDESERQRLFFKYRDIYDKCQDVLDKISRTPYIRTMASKTLATESKSESDDKDGKEVERVHVSTKGGPAFPGTSGNA